MSKSIKISIGLVLVAAATLVLVAQLGGDDDEPVPVAAGPVGSAPDLLVRADSQRLNEPDDSKATFVEFLDFECEACRAAHPAVEQLRDDYGDQVTFVVRYMPLHANSVAAAKAAEAAAAQGQFEEMYDLLFETQLEWGEQQSSQEEFFFGLADQLELDLERFRAVYDDPATEAKILRDQRDGEELGVQGTPTFFLEGEKLDVTSVDELVRAVENAVGG